jgi:hypothetical protein
MRRICPFRLSPQTLGLATPMDSGRLAREPVSGHGDGVLLGTPWASNRSVVANCTVWTPSPELLHLDLIQPFYPVAAQLAADHQPNGVAVLGRQDLAVHGVRQVGIVEQGFIEG